MIYVSFMELLTDAIDALSALHGDKLGTLYALLAFFGGMLLIMIIDSLVPDAENPHEARSVEEIGDVAQSQPDANAPHNEKLMRVGLVSALVLAIHNFPEGMVTFLAGLKDISIAIPIALAISIHNIPEGIAVSVPIYYATGDRKRAFWLSFLSGLSEPLGASWAIGLAPYLNDNMFGLMFAAIGEYGFISLDERHGKEHGEHLDNLWIAAGMAIMAVSLLLLGQIDRSLKYALLFEICRFEDCFSSSGKHARESRFQ